MHEESQLVYKGGTRDRRDQLPDTVRHTLNSTHGGLQLRKSERTPHQKKMEYKGSGVSPNLRPILRLTSFYSELWKSPLISQIVRLLYLFILNITWLTDSTTVQLLIL